MRKTCFFFSAPISISSKKGKKRAGSKSTFISSKYLQNAIKLKQKFLNNLFQYFSNFFKFFQFHFCTISKHLKAVVSIDLCHFSWMTNSYLKFLFLCHLIIPNRNELLYSSLWKVTFLKLKSFCFLINKQDNFRVWIPSETRMWHDKNIQSSLVVFMSELTL